jgi:hypothetical protein
MLRELNKGETLIKPFSIFRPAFGFNDPASITNRLYQDGLSTANRATTGPPTECPIRTSGYYRFF